MDVSSQDGPAKATPALGEMNSVSYDATTSRCRSVWTASPPECGRWSAIVSSSSAASHGVS